MKKNLGAVDRAIRAILGIAVLVLILTDVITGAAGIVLGIVAAALLITSAMSFCPVYLPLRISTLSKSAQTKDA